MLFKEFFSIYYGGKKNGKSLYKVFFTNEDATLFVQGYKIHDIFNDKWEFVCQRTLTKLSDWIVLDTDDESQVFKTKESGIFDIELTNPFEKGYSKVIKAQIEIKFQPSIQENSDFSSFLKEKLSILEDKLESLHAYLLLKLSVEFAILKFLNQNNIPYEEFLDTNLLQTINTPNFYYFASSNDSIRKHLKNILTSGTIKVTPENILNAIILLEEMVSNKLNLDNYSLTDYLFLLKLLKEVSLSSAIFSAKQLTQKFKDSIVIDKNYQVNKIKAQFLAIPKITKITLNIDNKQIFSEEIVPVYRTDVEVINTPNAAFTFYFKNKTGNFSISFIHGFPFLSWSLDDKTDKTKIQIGDIDNGFEPVYADERVFEIIIEKD